MNAVETEAPAPQSPPVPAGREAQPRPGRWKRRILPAAGGLAVVATISFWAASAGPPHAPARDAEAESPAPSTNVTVSPAEPALFERVLNVQGSVHAKHLALISPRVAGTLDAILVDEGDPVEAGVTRLFQTDPVKLAKTVEVRQHEVNVAEHALREKQALLEENLADYDKAEYDWNRYRGLYEKGVATDDEMEDADTEYRRCAAIVKHARALVDLAEAQLEQARSALAIARKDLDDSLIVAPISGRVAARYQEPGEMGSPGKPVLRIEDPSLLEVSVFLPARAYGEVVPGETIMHVVVNREQLGEHEVTYKSPTINDQLRTFEARCLLRDPPPAVAPGAMAHVRVVLERRQALAVPRDAVQRRSDGQVVFLADGDHARMVPISTGLEKGELTEVLAGSLAPGDPVITLGAYFLDPDAPITIQREANR